MILERKLLIIVSILLILFSIGSYFYINDLYAHIEKQQLEIKIQNQNEKALKNQLEMKSDSLQNYALFVQRLNDVNQDLTNKYNILESKYKIAIDSIKVLNDTTDVILTDSTITVEFSGKKGKVSYNGSTTYFTYEEIGTYSIEIGIDTTIIKSVVYADSGIVKNKVYTDGVLITDAITTIDSSIYSLLQTNNINNEKVLGFFDRLKLLSDNSFTIQQNKDSRYKIDEFNIDLGLEYMIKNNITIYGQKELLNNGAKIGVRLNPSIKDLSKNIVKFIF